jgi:hypothetical protein
MPQAFEGPGRKLTPCPGRPVETSDVTGLIHPMGYTLNDDKVSTFGPRASARERNGNRISTVVLHPSAGCA